MIIFGKVKEINDKFKQDQQFTPLDWQWVKAMIFVESGGPEYLEGQPWQYDPMQVANKGDFALSVVRRGEEHTDLLSTATLRQRLQTVEHTPFKQGRPNYDNYNGYYVLSKSRYKELMTAQLSIEVGVIWLFRKAFSRVVKESVVDSHHKAIRTYVVQQGDNYYSIHSKLETTVDELTAQNGTGILQIGQELKYRKANMEERVKGWQPWSVAIKRYNGGGNENYYQEVSEYYQKIKRGEACFK